MEGQVIVDTFEKMIRR